MTAGRVKACPMASCIKITINHDRATFMQVRIDEPQLQRYDVDKLNNSPGLNFLSGQTHKFEICTPFILTAKYHCHTSLVFVAYKLISILVFVKFSK